ncbi:MAG: type I restriction-modification system subunit M [Candidatus Peregrinibacteria bacterium]|nr:type I restriction-modification system subunit M [Candidatus Peregrinibacteria bacterium]
MSEDQKRILERQLWGVANVLRGKMNADEYKNYILGFIFYKYLSEKLERYVNEKVIVGEKFTFAEINEDSKEGKEDLDHIKTACVGELGFFLRPTELFSYLVKKGKGEIKNQKTFILEDLKNILNDIEKTSAGTASEDDFKGLFDDMDLTSSKLGSRENDKNEVVVEVLALLSGIDFKLEDAKSDLLGDAYEYLIGEFAAGAGKKGGEFYTPAQVSRLLAQIVSMDKKRIKSAYDATCGSGSLLLRLGEFTDVVNYYGQELNPTTYNLARMNMILHGVHFDRFSIRQGDTLKEDMHPDLKAEAIVANPPFSAQWKGDTDPTLAHDDRFSQYGRLAPKSAADYAFVTHMLHHLAENGTMAIVLPHGALFRSGAEGHIRKYIIEKLNYLDTVIGLPANLFYGTSIPATVLVFKKCRREDENILLIDASKEFEKVGNQNKLTDENIKKIFDTYKTRKEIEKYSHRANISEIKENDYNLNIPRYVDTFEEEKIIDIEEVAKILKELHSNELNLQNRIAEFCDELKIDKPF